MYISIALLTTVELHWFTQIGNLATEHLSKTPEKSQFYESDILNASKLSFLNFFNKTFIIDMGILLL